MTTKAIWFDFGGVFTPPVTETVTTFSARIDVEPEDFLRAAIAVAADYGVTDPMAPLDTPLGAEEEWVRRVESALRETTGKAVNLSGFSRLWFTDRAPCEPMVDLARRLRGVGHFVGMLSNMVPSFEAHWREMVPPDLFDELVFSYRVGCRKPEPRIYGLAAEAAETRAEDCLLIDDLEMNCDAARRCGWQAVHFTDPEGAISEIDRLIAI